MKKPVLADLAVAVALPTAGLGAVASAQPDYHGHGDYHGQGDNRWQGGPDHRSWDASQAYRSPGHDHDRIATTTSIAATTGAITAAATTEPLVWSWAASAARSSVTRSAGTRSGRWWAPPAEPRSAAPSIAATSAAADAVQAGRGEAPPSAPKRISASSRMDR